MTGEPTPAAVLLPFYRDGSGAARLVLIERTRHGPHGGQIALPGGKREPSDATMRDTAVRETCEELGLTIEALDVLDELPPLRTRSTGFKVWPFVGRLREPGKGHTRWRPQQREVASVLDLAVADLVDPSAHGQQEMDLGPLGHLRVPVWLVHGHTTWGLTLRILEPVLPRVLAGDYPI